MKQQPIGRPQVPIRFRAKVIALRETFVNLSASFHRLGHAQQRADGRWVVPVALTPQELEPLVAGGVTVVIEGFVDPFLPADRIMPYEQAVAEAERVVQVLSERNSETSAPGKPDV